MISFKKPDIARNLTNVTGGLMCFLQQRGKYLSWKNIDQKKIYIRGKF